MEIILATNNFDKVREMKHILQGSRIRISTLRDFPHLKKVKEDGKTFRENAIKKAVAIARLTGRTALADDSGLEVKEIGGKPGIYSSRFAGENCTYTDNNKKVLKLMKDIPLSKRQARFVCVIAVASPDGRVKVATGICKGKIATEIRGKSGFGYDPVFVPDRYRSTFAELGPEIKNKMSHRARALLKAKKFL